MFCPNDCSSGYYYNAHSRGGTKSGMSPVCIRSGGRIRKDSTPVSTARYPKGCIMPSTGGLYLNTGAGGMDYPAATICIEASQSSYAPRAPQPTGCDGPPRDSILRRHNMKIGMFAIITLIFTLCKIIAYFIWLRPLQFGELASATKGWQVFQLSTGKLSQDAAMTPKQWGERMIDPVRAEENELIHIERKGNDDAKLKYIKHACQNMIRAIAITYNDCLVESIKMVDTIIGHGQETVKALPAVFGNVNRVKSVDLRGNHLGNTIMELCEAPISSNKTVEFLDFGKNGITVSGGQSLGRAIKANKGIEFLVLDSNKFGRSLVDLMNGLADNTALKRFQLRDVSAGNNVKVLTEFGHAFGESMKKNKVLEQMDFTNNHFPAPGFANMMAGLYNNAGAGNTTLLTLILETCKIDDECAKHFGKMLGHNASLKTINFRNNSIGNGGGLTISDGLRANKPSALGKGLASLDLQKNNQFQFVTLVKIHRGGMDGADPKIMTDDNDTKLRNCAKAWYNEPDVTNLDVTECRIEPFDAAWLKKEVLLTNHTGTGHNTHVTTLDISSNPLEDEGGIAIFESLVVNKTIQNLFVRSCQIDDGAGQTLVSVLPENKGLVKLVITGNNIDRFVTLVLIHRGGMDGTDPAITTDGSDRKLIDCAKAMYNDPSVKVLDISSCNVHASDAAWLKKEVLLTTHKTGKGLNTHVWKLDIGSNPLGDDGCNYIAQALKKNLVIKTLLMNSCQVGNEGGETLADALKSQEGKNGGLSKTLELTGNPAMAFYCLVTIHRACMDAAGATVSTDLPDHKLRNTALAMRNDPDIQELDISSCRIQDFDGEWLAREVIIKNTVIHTLNMNSNNAESGGAGAIAEAMMQNTSCNIQIFTIDGNSIGNNGSKAIARAVGSRSSKLFKVVVSNNSFDKDSASEWGSAIRSSDTIKTLDFESNNFQSSGVRALSEGMVSNGSLNWIDLSNNGMGNDGAKAFARVLENKGNNALVTARMQNNSCTFRGHAMMWEAAMEKTRDVELSTDGDRDNLINVGAVANGYQYSNVEVLDMNQQDLDSEDHSWFGTMIGQRAVCLKELHMKQTGVTSAGITNMGGSNSLETLILSSNTLGNKYSAIKSMMSDCSSLRRLELDNSDIGGGGLEVVRGVPYSNLSVLSMYVLRHLLAPPLVVRHACTNFIRRRRHRHPTQHVEVDASRSFLYPLHASLPSHKRLHHTHAVRRVPQACPQLGTPACCAAVPPCHPPP